MHTDGPGARLKANHFSWLVPEHVVCLVQMFFSFAPVFQHYLMLFGFSVISNFQVAYYIVYVWQKNGHNAESLQDNGVQLLPIDS